MRAFSLTSYVAFVGIGLLIAMAGLAFGQDTTPVPDSVVVFDGFLGWLRPYVMELLSVIIGACVVWATKKFHDLTGMNIEAKHREALQSALRNGANLVLDKIPDHVAIDVRSTAVAKGIDYVLGSVPDAVKYFELSPEKIAELLKPKIVAPPSVVVADHEHEVN